MLGDGKCGKSVIQNSEAKGDSSYQKIPGRCVSSEIGPDVYTRVIYNSKLSKKDVEGLIARGNRARFMRPGNVTPVMKQNGKKDVGKYNSRVVVNKCMVYSRTPHFPTPHFPEEKGGATKEGGACSPVAPAMNSILKASQGVNLPEVLCNVSVNNRFTPLLDTKDNGTDWEQEEKRVVPEGNNPTKNVSMNKNIHTNNQNKVLLFDINNCDDKFLNVTGKKKLEELLKVKGDTKIVPFDQWRKQSDFEFGFVPLSDFILPDRFDCGSDHRGDPFELYSRIRKSGKLNFLGCRIPVRSQLNILAWQEMLQEYWDVQLLELLKFGFPLDFNRTSTLCCKRENHSSALQYPSHVEAYLQEEIEHGAILGPFQDHPIKNCHFSPFLTREKSGSDKRRVIIDLSWPQGCSVNSGIDKNSYLGTDFALTFPSVDHITAELTRLGSAAHLYKIDVSRAFRHVKLDPSDYDLLGLLWNDVTFIDTCLPFGARHGTQIFQRISDAVRYGLRQRGHCVINYVDDFVGVGTPSVASASYDCLLELLRRLGLDVSKKKLCPPSTKAVCLGVEIDTVACTISVPPDKLQRIRHMVDAWGNRRFCSVRQLQSLLGHLMYIQKCVKPSRYFVNRILELLRSNYDAHSVTLTQDFKRDIRWFKAFLTQYNGSSFYDHKPVQAVLELDACLTGLGGRYNEKVYHLPIARHYKNLHITQLEMINILVAIRIFGPTWSHKKVLIKCDNLAVVQVLQSGRTRDAFMAACVRNVWLEAALSDVQLIYKHFPGKLNSVADLLSRWQNTAHQFHLLQCLVPNFLWVPVSSDLLEINNEI